MVLPENPAVLQIHRDDGRNGVALIAHQYHAGRRRYGRKWRLYRRGVRSPAGCYGDGHEAGSKMDGNGTALLRLRCDKSTCLSTRGVGIILVLRLSRLESTYQLERPLQASGLSE